MESNVNPVKTSAQQQSVTKKPFSVSLAIKVTAIIALAIALVAAASNLIIYNLSYHALSEEIRDKLMMVASNAAVTLEPEKLKTIKTSEDEGNEAYLELQKKLQQVKEASMDKIKYVYTVAKSGDSYIYVLDAAPIDDEDHSAVGDEFAMEDFPEAINGFKAPAADKKPELDPDFGWLQSGYAPIKDAKGNVIGMLGVDMDVSTLKKEEAQLSEARMIAFAIAIILAVLLGIGLSRYLTKPILMLTKGTQKVAEGDFDTVVTIKRGDEFGQLANSFNAMTQDLKISHEELKRYNLELEDKVAQRTAELSQINKEIKDILDNMSQAIFTIDKDFKFNAQHSRFAIDIFGNIPFANRRLPDVFFPDESQKDDKSSMVAWLKRVISSPDTDWSNMEALQPVREIRIKVRETDGKDVIKYIKVDFQPIIDLVGPNYKEEITKIMVIVQDITDKKSLELEMNKKEQEYRDNINQIVEIINADKELFDDFVNECRENLVNFEPMLIQLKDNKEDMAIINNLFRIMHTLKGNARIFNLERIAGQAHIIENTFSAIRKGEKVMTDELLDETFKELDRFNGLFNEILDIYDKISRGKNADLGKTRTEERNKEESEVIKVRIHDINRLAELIKKADRLVLGHDSEMACGYPDKAKIVEVENILKETEKQILSMKKIALSRLFTRIPRMVRDISQQLGKKVKLVTGGDEIEVDKNIFDKIGDPLIHILRNSLDHGIEKPEERILMGKPEEGTIELKSSLTDSELLVEIRDDGNGLDIDKIKAKAVKKGLITPEAALEMPDSEAVNIIFMPGFSTNDRVTDISGRGVGMDVVKTSIEDNLKGKIIVESKKYQGLKVTLRVPLAS